MRENVYVCIYVIRRCVCVCIYVYVAVVYDVEVSGGRLCGWTGGWRARGVCVKLELERVPWDRPLARGLFGTRLTGSSVRIYTFFFLNNYIRYL